MNKLLEAIGQYGAQCSQTKELAPPRYLLDELDKLEEELAALKKADVEPVGRVNGKGLFCDGPYPEHGALLYTAPPDTERQLAELQEDYDNIYVGEPFGYWHQGDTEDESDFHLHSYVKDLNKNCKRCIPLYKGSPNTEHQLAEALAREKRLRDALETIRDALETTGIN